MSVRERISKADPRNAQVRDAHLALAHNRIAVVWTIVEILCGGALVLVGGLDLVYRWSLPLSEAGMHATELMFIGLIVMGYACIRTLRRRSRQTARDL